METAARKNAMPRFAPAGTALMLLVAVAITTAMDANGLSAFSALPLLPLAAAGWWLERHSREAMGIAWGRLRDYGLAVAYPAIVLGALAAIAWVAAASHPATNGTGNVVRNFAIMAGATIPAAILTEEGFFRGWLVASLRRLGLGSGWTLASSSLAFALWHVSAVSLDTGFGLPAAQIPVYLANAAVMGAIWGAMRLRSGSIVVASVSHGLWNGGAYVLFGYGAKIGSLGIEHPEVYGPESGYLGLLLNIAFLVSLCGSGLLGGPRIRPAVAMAR